MYMDEDGDEVDALSHPSSSISSYFQLLLLTAATVETIESTPQTLRPRQIL